MRLHTATTLLALLLVLPAVSACGRRGPLEPPGGAVATTPAPAPGTAAATVGDPAIPSSARALGEEAAVDENAPAEKAPDRPFVLDPLL